jgi:uncharacterized DUF497 family protein
MHTEPVRLDYDPAKNAANLRKHGVDLEDAELVLFDPRALVREDTGAENEQRFVAVGTDARGRILTVIYTYREPDDPAYLGPTSDEERTASL